MYIDSPRYRSWLLECAYGAKYDALIRFEESERQGRAGNIAKMFSEFWLARTDIARGKVFLARLRNEDETAANDELDIAVMRALDWFVLS